MNSAAEESGGCAPPVIVSDLDAFDGETHDPAVSRRSRLDEAVEVAIAEWHSTFRPAPQAMRAALLSALPVLLGEVVGYMDGDGYIWGREEDGEAYFHPHPASLIRVYAPSLGEGGYE